MTALIYLTGIAVFALVIYLTLELHLQPSEKGSKRYPHISDGFGGQRLGASVPTSRFILVSQPGHVASQVGRLNIRYLSISDVFQPMTKSELIGGNCALA